MLVTTTDYDEPLTKQLAYILYIYTNQEGGQKALDTLPEGDQTLYELIYATKAIIKA
jgi:hypothetical protein